MSLLGGDLTTPQRVANWMANAPVLPSTVLAQLIGSMSRLINNKLNRGSLASQVFSRTFDGVGNMQIVLPDYPVTNIISLQVGQTLIPPSILPAPSQTQPAGSNPGYGFRYIPWGGDLPGAPTTLEFAGGWFWTGPQNIKVTYQAGYLVAAEPWTVPTGAGPTITVLQQQGIWCRDNGVVYASSGVALTPVTTLTAAGQYIAPVDAQPGVYTFGVADANANVLISYSFVPADLEEAAIQMVVERYSYRTRVGEISKSLGGQETVRFMRGSSGYPWSTTGSLPPEVMDLVWPYVSVLYPNIGAPL